MVWTRCVWDGKVGGTKPHGLPFNLEDLAPALPPVHTVTNRTRAGVTFGVFSHLPRVNVAQLSVRQQPCKSATV